MLAAMPDERGPAPVAGVLPYANASSPIGPKRQLSVLDGVAVIIGIVVGTGIYESVDDIARGASSLWGLVALWVLGGAVSLIGAMCYAELATAYPRDGGEYVFLRQAYGRPVGFLFAWTGFWIIRPGSIGAMAFVFARYAQRLMPIGGEGSAGWGFGLYALLAVLVLSGVNVMGVKTGKWTQNILTAAKVVGLLAVFGVGLFLIAPRSASAPISKPSTLDFKLAVIFVLWAYGGWNDMSYVAAEVKDFRRNIWRA